tara:strand:+ start:516 stop:746 length:231 start_codon:yes stop_codon:yes gene_type:complete
LNERLKELAIEANLIAAMPNGFDSTQLSVAQIRFSGLLIKECYTIMQPMIRYQVGRNLALDAIKEHFGYDFGVYDE